MTKSRTVGARAGCAVAGAQAWENEVENNLAVLSQGIRLVAQGCTQVAACHNVLKKRRFGKSAGNWYRSHRA